MKLISLLECLRKPRVKMGVPNTLTGYFELRSGRIVGWVREICGYNAAAVQIDVIGPLGTIMSCEAAPEPEHNRFVFVLPVDGRFSEVDLVREKVVVAAHDSEGNSGRVLLDGIAQLALIREYLGVPAATIVDMDFTIGGNARRYLGPGWSHEEPDFTWTQDDDSIVMLPTPNEPGKYVLRFSAGSFIRTPEPWVQELTLFVGTTQIGHITCTTARVAFHECAFSYDAFDPTLQTPLRLHHPGAVRPSDLDVNEDTRRLAFYFKRLTLVRLLSEGEADN